MLLNAKKYGEENQGTPLLVFHGLFGMLDNWASFGKALAEEYAVHLIDLRNHGKSFHSDAMSHDDLAQDIAYYMDHFGMEKAHLLGHSLGGKAVMQFAIQFPQKVSKLIVADIAPKAYPPHHQGIIKALQSVDFSAVNSRKEVEVVLSDYIREESVIQFLMKSLYWTENKRLSWRFNLQVLAEKYNDFVANAIRFGTFNGETLFVAGEKSHYILPQDHFSIRQQFPHFELVTVPDAGHWLHAENPDYFTQVVIDFLKK